MKLKSLYESTLSGLNLSKFTENLDPADVDVINNILKLCEGFKVTLDDVNHEDQIFIRLSNSIVDFDITIVKEIHDSDESYPYYPIIEFVALVNSNLVAFPQSVDEGNLSLVTLTDRKLITVDPSVNNFSDEVEEIAQTVKLAKEFTDWYFEISGKHGKLLLVKVLVNPLLSDEQSQRRRWIPAIGSFYCRGYGQAPTIEVAP